MTSRKIDAGNISRILDQADQHESEAMDATTLKEIGQLQSQVAILLNAVERNSEKGDQGRSRIYEELEAIRAEQADAKRRIVDLERVIAGHASTLSTVNDWRQKLEGARMLATFIVFTCGGGFVAAGYWILTKLGVVHP